jgi:hypothetical protein
MVEGGLSSREERELTRGAVMVLYEPGELIRSLGNPSFLCSPQFGCLRSTAFGIKCLKAVFALKMTFDPISYVYAPTALRSKSTKSRNRTTSVPLARGTILFN